MLLGELVDVLLSLCALALKGGLGLLTGALKLIGHTLKLTLKAVSLPVRLTLGLVELLGEAGGLSLGLLARKALVFKGVRNTAQLRLGDALLLLKLGEQLVAIDEVAASARELLGFLGELVLRLDQLSLSLSLA